MPNETKKKDFTEKSKDFREESESMAVLFYLSIWGLTYVKRKQLWALFVDFINKCEFAMRLKN